MAFLKVKNRAVSTLASGISDSDLSLTVAAGEGALFPSTYPFHVTIEDEILECTSRSTDVLTVTRAAEDTVAAAHTADKAVELRVTAAIITELQAHDPLTTGVHGVGAYNIAKDLIPSTLTKYYLGTDQNDIAVGTNPMVQLDTVVVDAGSNFHTGDWYGADGAYRQADADASAAYIRDDDANFPAAIFGALVKWASDAAGTENVGVGYIKAPITSDAVAFVKTSGADFAASYYYWIKKAYYVAPITGYYACFFQLQYKTGVEADKRYGVYIYVNGVYSIAALYHASVADMMRLPHNGVLGLTEGDIVSLHGYTDGTHATADIGSGLGNTVMSIFCLLEA